MDTKKQKMARAGQIDLNRIGAILVVGYIERDDGVWEICGTEIDRGDGEGIAELRDWIDEVHCASNTIVQLFHFDIPSEPQLNGLI